MRILPGRRAGCTCLRRRKTARLGHGSPTPPTLPATPRDCDGRWSDEKPGGGEQAGVGLQSLWNEVALPGGGATDLRGDRLQARRVAVEPRLPDGARRADGREAPRVARVARAEPSPRLGADAQPEPRRH